MNNNSDISQDKPGIINRQAIDLISLENAGIVRLTRYQVESILIFIMLMVTISGGYILSGQEAGLACSSWPFCHAGLTLPRTPVEWVSFIHRIMVLVLGILILYHFNRAWKVKHNNPASLISASLLFVFLIADGFSGRTLAENGTQMDFLFHRLLMVAIGIASLADLVFSIRSRIQDGEPGAGFGIQRLTRDFFPLTKPIVVLLLLVTTFVGMVLGKQGLPGFELTVWTLVGGFLAAGGASAINQYLDRSEDARMQRTMGRPIPSGRISPAEGLAFGISISIASFLVVLTQVNLLAAMLTVAGHLYYVILYTLLLKKSTVQNIVIGGGAGAIPPLVGWAAATGALPLQAWLLFGLIFLWTPPHFWALALVRRKDYSRAGIPMLPVVRGEEETHRQILLYTIILVFYSIVMVAFGLGGLIYLAGAILLGLWLLAGVVKLWKTGGNKAAWKVYRYSSMYLAFLCLILVLDTLFPIK